MHTFDLSSSFQFTPQMDDSSEAAEEKRRKFEAHRKAHYQTGSLAELRAKTANLDSEEEH